MKRIKLIGLALCLLLCAACDRAAQPSASSSPQAPPSSSLAQPEETPPPIPRYGVIRNPGEEPLCDEAVETLLLEFMDRYYASLTDLQARDLTDLFDTAELAGAEGLALNELTLSYAVESRRQRTQDLSLDAPRYGLTILHARQEEDGALRIFCQEDSQVRFSFLEQASTHVGYHAFVLVPHGEGYRLRSHTDRQDAALAIWEAYRERREEMAPSGQLSAEMAQSLITELGYQLMVEEFEPSLQALQQAGPLPALEPPVVDYPYDREAAVAYAREWVGEQEPLRNDRWQDYEMLGGDCNNFISQCLYAGGIPMDTQGAAIWKWYGDTPSSLNTAYGRSPSWTSVDDFYWYCRDNQGAGLVAQVDLDLRYAEPGDILQFWALGEWRHSVIVTDRVADELLVHSHSADRADYPVSGYLFPTVRLIKIWGWNAPAAGEAG